MTNLIKNHSFKKDNTKRNTIQNIRRSDYSKQMLISAQKRLSLQISSIDFSKKQTFYLPYGLIILHLLVQIIRYIYCLYWIEPVLISSNIIYVLISGILPFIVWALSTICDDFNYYQVKKGTLFLVVAHLVLCIIEPLWTLFYELVCLKILSTKVTEAMTIGMILGLCRLAMFFITGIIAFFLGSAFFMVLFQGSSDEEIDRFRLSNLLDMRTDKDTKYDLKILKDQSGFGKVMPIYEEDLYTHLLCIGASGTGKTSSSLIPMIIGYLDQKVKNKQKREQALLQLVTDKKAYVKGPVSVITERNVYPVKGYEEELETVRKKYPDCGITVVSPNASIGNDIVRLCRARDFSVNMIDPVKTYDSQVVQQLGIHPFYVPTSFRDFDVDEENEKAVLIVNQAKIFSETLIMVNEASGDGGGEKYFKDLNTSVTTNIAIICMLDASIRKTQTGFGEIQDCINDFTKLKEKCENIKDHYQLKIEEFIPGNAKAKDHTRYQKVTMDDYRAFEEMMENMTPEKLLSKQTEQEKQQEETPRAYRFAVQYVQNELFASGEKMFDQARGLRNLLNDMVFDQRIYKILNGRGAFLNFDKTLAECEITVLNTAQEISTQVSTSLGLFFILNHKRAVLRRAEHDRPPHFLIVDECSQYMHPWMEDAVAQYRQYKCAVTFSFQSLAQLDKSKQTQYIKGVLLTIANIIVYGRVGLEEMKTFETMGGYKKIQETMKGDMKSSILIENASHTISERTMQSEEAVASGTNLRMRGFQEVTWIGTVKGNVQFAKLAKLSFADKKCFEKQKTDFINWEQFVPLSVEYLEKN